MWNRINKYFPRWLQTNCMLREANRILSEEINNSYEINKGLNTVLAFNYAETAKLKSEFAVIMAAAAIQHSGELKIKPDFLQMAEGTVLNVDNSDDGGIVLGVRISAEQNSVHDNS